MDKLQHLRFMSCKSGATAVEFAILTPPFLMLVLGTLSACVVVFTAANLHYAVEGAARCYSVNISQCGSTATAQSYAQSLYFGPSSPTFTASSTGTCFQVNGTSTGHEVSGTLNMVLDVGIWQANVPLSATACFP
jgi:Flp pilus assembly protein TadG